MRSFSSEPNITDPQELRRCLRDIIALSTLPAMWYGAEPLRVAESLAASLFTTLAPKFVYIRFSDIEGMPLVEVTQTERYHTAPALDKETGRALLDWARNHDPDDLLTLVDPLGSVPLRITVRPIGSHAELGIIAAAFVDSASPTSTHHLLLNVGASQATIAISNANLLRSLRESEQRDRHANAELAERVAELQKANAEVQNARRAALNMMEDALAARQQAEQAAAALQQSETRLSVSLDQLRKRNERQQLLADALGQLLQAQDPQLIVRALFSKVAAHLGVDTYFNYMVNEQGDALRLHSCAGITEETARSIERLEFGTAICGTVAQTRLPIHATDIQHSDYDKAALVRGFGIQSYACNPLMVGGRLLGTLSFASRTRTAFDEEELQFLSIIAQYTAVAMERLQSAAQVRQSEERFRSLVSVISDVPWVTDASGAFIAPQPAWEAYTGQSWTEHQGFGWANALHPDDRERVRQIWEKACASASLYQSEGRLWHAPSQKWRYFVAKATPLFRADGSLREWIGACIDVDEQKRGQDWLENTVAERTQELQQANAALLHDMEERKKLEGQLLQAQKMESIGVLAGGIAHDFNNILNIIQAHAFLLRASGARDKNVNESATVIKETVERGAALVQQLLTLARKSSTHLESVNINALVQGLGKLITQTFPKTIELSASLEPDLPPIMADKNHIEQALLNLCVNARDAMPEGGKLLFRTASNPGGDLEDLGGNPREDYVTIELRDTGIGMDESVRKRIFEPFFTTKDIGQGTGLGLSVVYGIVKNHNGFIHVESDPGSGTVFRLYFPVAKAEIFSHGEAVKNAAETATVRNGAATVLLVEDEPNMLSVLEKVLSGRGYKILKAADGETAVALYQRHKAAIDIVLLDLGLPKISGRDVLTKIKKENPHATVIIASGYLEPEAKLELRRAGVRSFLHKPYMPDDIVKTFQSLAETSTLEVAEN